MTTKLHRSRKEQMIGGVCGGLGAYLKLDPTLVRIFFVILAFGDGIGILLYFLMWFLIPLEGKPSPGTLSERFQNVTDEFTERAQNLGKQAQIEVHLRERRTTAILGTALIVLGGVFFLERLDLPWLEWFSFGVLWPILLIVGGIVLILRRPRGGSNV